jgi:hypothetical protein
MKNVRRKGKALVVSTEIAYRAIAARASTVNIMREYVILRKCQQQLGKCHRPKAQLATGTKIRHEHGLTRAQHSTDRVQLISDKAAGTSLKAAGSAKSAPYGSLLLDSLIIHKTTP